MSSPRRIGLTGGIGTGKSTVLRCLSAAGVPTLDTDEVARQVVRRGEPAYHAVVAAFGPEVLGPDGELDRPVLARRVFGSAVERRRLEAIVHPAVWEAVSRFFTGHDGPCVVAIPLLFETGREAAFDRVLVTHCPEAAQIARVMARDGLGEAAVRARLAAQMPSADRLARADAVIDTSGTIEATRARLDEVWQAWGLGSLTPPHA